MPNLLERMSSGVDAMTNSAGEKVLQELQVKPGSNGSGFNTRQEWKSALDAFKKENGTTRGFKGGTVYTDADGQKWNYVHGSKGGAGGMRKAEATQRMLSNRHTLETNAKYQLKDFTDAYGPEKGQSLFDQHQAEVRRIEKVTPKGFDLDHIDSLKDGGTHHPKNLRAQLRSRNRSEAARGVTPHRRNLLGIAQTRPEQVRLQGPRPTPLIRQEIIGGKFGGNILGILPEVAEVINSKTDGGFDKAVIGTIDAGRNLFINGAKWWGQKLMPQQQSNTNYGQY